MKKIIYLVLIISSVKGFAQSASDTLKEEVLSEDKKEMIKSIAPKGYAISSATFYHYANNILFKETVFDAILLTEQITRHIYKADAKKLPRPYNGVLIYYNLNSVPWQKIQYSSGNVFNQITYQHQKNKFLSQKEEYRNAKNGLSIDNKSVYRYNAKNQLVEEKKYNFPDEKLAQTIVYQYNQQGKLAAKADNNPYLDYVSKTNYQYNKAGLLTAEIQVTTGYGKTSTFTITYAYNALKQLVTKKEEGGGSYTQEHNYYNKNGKLILVDEYSSLSKSIEQKQIYNYNKLGQLELLIAVFGGKGISKSMP